MTNNDLIIKSKSGMRGKRSDATKGGRIEARVYLGGDYEGYGHPSVSLVVVRTWESTKEEYDTTLLSVGFQRNRQLGLYDVPAKGFMKGPTGRTYSGCYAGRVEGRLEDIRHVDAGMRLLERAKEAIRESDGGLRIKLATANCDLLTLIVGLRKIGVTVVIKDAKKAKQWSIAA